MTVGFKRPIEVTVHVPTPEADLIEVAGGYNQQGRSSVDVFEDDGTGYENFFTDYTIPATFTPGVAKRYDLQLQGYRFLGECSIKVHSRYEDLIASGSHLTIGSVQWDYQRLSELGVGAGNDRIVLALTRRKDA